MLLALALLVFGVLGVVACGGDDDETSDNGDDGGAQTSAPADDGDSGGDEETATPEGEDDPTDAPDDGGDDGGSDGGDFDASQVCDILSKEDVESAFGVSMLDPEYIPLPDAGGATVGSCSYVAAETTDSYSLTLYAGGSAEALFSGACSGKDSAGVGDDSCWFSEAHTEIQMLSGSNFVDMFVTTVDGDPEAISATLADRIHGQIGG
jgi:hypothetical protein